jgi:hypothetical protein
MCAKREGNSTLEIEITEEMIGAAEDVLWDLDWRHRGSRKLIVEALETALRTGGFLPRVAEGPREEQ